MRIAGWILIVMAVVLHFSVCAWGLYGWQSCIVPFLPFVHAREQFYIHSSESYNTMGAGFWGLMIPVALAAAGIGLIRRAAEIKAILAQIVARAAGPRRSTEQVTPPPIPSVVSPTNPKLPPCPDGGRMTNSEAVLEEVKARRFTLVDENGKPRATLTMLTEGPCLSLLDENGKKRAGLGVLKDGPGFSFYDENGKQRARLGVEKDGACLSLFDANDKPRVALTMFHDHPCLGLLDENGKPRASLTVLGDGPMFALLDENGNFRASLMVLGDGTILELHDENGKTRAGLEVDKDGPFLRLYDENGKALRSLP